MFVIVAMGTLMAGVCVWRDSAALRCTRLSGKKLATSGKVAGELRTQWWARRTRGRRGTHTHAHAYTTHNRTQEHTHEHTHTHTRTQPHTHNLNRRAHAPEPHTSTRIRTSTRPHINTHAREQDTCQIKRKSLTTAGSSGRTLDQSRHISKHNSSIRPLAVTMTILSQPSGYSVVSVAKFRSHTWLEKSLAQPDEST